MQFQQITMAVNDMPAMVEFYNAVFDAELAPIQSPMGVETPQFYKGQFLGIDLLFCPNSLLNIQAERNRHQFHLTVDDVDSLVTAGKNAGGWEFTETIITDEGKIASLSDPDGNTVVLSQLI
jgi:predicted enzyme related to lactoylglutathione lyase